MQNKTSHATQWIILILVSLALLLGYFFAGEGHGEELTPFLKGLSTLKHFGIHYVVGIFFGLCIIIGYFLTKHRRPQEAIILLSTILWSHFPDIKFFLTGGYHGHSPWEIIFFFHTLVDEFPLSLWIFLALDIILFFIYLSVQRKKLWT